MESKNSIFSHVTIGSADIERASHFYDKIFLPLGLKRRKSFRTAVGYAPDDAPDMRIPFWILKPLNRQAASPGNGVTIALNANTRAAVDAFHAAAITAGGVDEGAPGLRDHYHPNYYGAYIRDLDGNKICVVCHGEKTESRD